MYLVSITILSLVGALACLGPIANVAADVLDIGVVFPRQNETYAPSERFPVIIALQNAQLATHLKPTINFEVLNGSMTVSDVVGGEKFNLKWANYTNYTDRPYLLYAFNDFRMEGPLWLLFEVGWRMCNQTREGEDYITTNHTERRELWVDFAIREGAQTPDLVTATAEEEECPPHVGLAMNVTDETHDVSYNPVRQRLKGTCSVLDSSSPIPDPNPCRVKIDQAAVESIEAEDLEWRCTHQGWDLVEGCPERDHALQQLVVAGGVTFAAVLAAIAFLMA